MVHLNPGGTGARIEIQFCSPATPPPEASSLPAAAEEAAAAVKDEEHDSATRAGTSSLAEGAGDVNSAEKKPKEDAAGGANTEHNGRGDVDGGAGNDASGGGPVVPLYAGVVEEAGGEDGDLGVAAEDWEGQDGACGRVETKTWSRHGRWRVPCFLKPTGGGTANGARGGHNNELPPLALEVREIRTR